MTTLLLLIAITAQPSAMIEAADAYPGVKFHHGERDPLLVRLAQETADTLARRGEWGYRFDGHPGWDAKYQTIRKQLGMRAVEVSARSWRGQTVGIERGMYDSWRASTGHWRVVSTPHKRYGEGIAKSRRGTYFSAVIVAD
jgi:hypothetical protein